MQMISETPSNRLADYIKVTDLVFAGLSLNISNLNIVKSNGDTAQKMYILILSIFQVVFLTSCLNTMSQQVMTTFRQGIVVYAVVLWSVATNSTVTLRFRTTQNTYQL